MHIRFALCALVLTLAGPLPAQQPTTLAPGTRVRLVGRWDSARVMQGEIRRLYRDTLVIYDPVANGEWAVPLEWIGSLKVRRSFVRVTEPTVLLGIAVGTWLGWTLGYAHWTPCDHCLIEAPRELDAAGWALAGAAFGLGAGGGLAFLLKRNWREVPLSDLRVTPAPLPASRLGLGASFGF
jgi:hypothetical protein